MRKQSTKDYNKYNIVATAVIVVLVVLLAGLYFGRIKVFALDMYEDVAIVVAPSASRAFTYGDRHFNASDPAEYDLGRAEKYFTIAVEIDPSYPYAYHQLSRISFLKGQFNLALEQIDKQINYTGDTTPRAYYMRGLIEGFQGDYIDAATDYKHFLQFDPNNWAGINDYAWVLLKGGQFQDAANITAYGLQYFPDSPWLLNSNATALYEIGSTTAALVQAQKALQAVQTLTTADWLHAYPGNDPLVAAEGLAAFKKATIDNMHMIEMAASTSMIKS